MLEIKFVTQNLDKVEQALNNRGANADLNALAAADRQRKTVLGEIEQLRHQRNVVSEKIAALKKEGQDANEMVGQMRSVGERIKSLDKKLSEHVEQVRHILMGIPNIPHASVPVGRDEQDNTLVKTHGDPPEFPFDPKPHWDIGEDLGILDLGRAAQITGARFPLLLGQGALLERALLNFMLHLHTTEHGYTEVLPPFMVNRQSMTNTGQLPKFEEDLFKIEDWDYFLIPTAEVPVTNIHQSEKIPEEKLPLYYTAFTPCFRSEAGSYGKDTRGLIRQHQFNKVELVKFTTPETSYDELEQLLANAETVLQRLELPYRVVTLCPAIWAFQQRKPTISKFGCRPRAFTGRLAHAVILKIFKRAAPISASNAKASKAHSWSTP
jgi:seryl-tRNA synthetase